MLNPCKFSKNVSITKRHLSQKCPSSKQIRKDFLNYFTKDNNHSFIRSSPVVPFHDPTVPFVNAGMNQFKSIFLGKTSPVFTKVANSQKCIRVGGKHNDLEAVGKDGYHHTFFEMLGNWSFGECSKEEACSLAWKLLTQVYKINKNLLYVTYFAGDENLGIPADKECIEIWKHLGLPQERIIGFGCKDNFWEMGLSGPCGPCTEIHYDHIGGADRAKLVNKGLHELIELWNIVFIEYNRDAEGKINVLPAKHVDTGMGFERLVSVLQGKISNYDTDVFNPLFNGIHKFCSGVPKYQNCFGENDWDQLNTSYRILADHVRTITAGLADGAIPEQNQKLRRILRRACAISDNVFYKEKGLLKELSNYVVENLGHVYPEMEKNISQVHQIIDYEEDLYLNLRSNAVKEWNKFSSKNEALKNLDVIEMPGLIRACRDIEKANLKEISPQYAYKLYDTFGLDDITIKKLGTAYNLSLNEKEIEEEMALMRSLSKKSTNHNLIDVTNFEETNDESKYDYLNNKGVYIFNKLEVEILGIINSKSEFVDSIEPNEHCILILNKTNLYSEEGGQICDRGVITFTSGVFKVENVQKLNNRVLHHGKLKSDSPLTVKTQGILSIDENRRFNCMQNHTATHLLNSVLKIVKGATCQKSSKVTNEYLNFDVSIFNEKLNVDDIKNVEEKIFKFINKGLGVNHRLIDSQEFLMLDHVTVVPGEVYPETGIRLIEIIDNDDIISREPCCGTHVTNIGHVFDFSIISYKSLGRSSCSIYAVTGSRAKVAKINAKKLKDAIHNLKLNLKKSKEKISALESNLLQIKQQLNYEVDSDIILPYVTKMKSIEALENISKDIKELNRNELRNFIDHEMKSVLNNKNINRNEKQFIVHYLDTAVSLDVSLLNRATTICSDYPVMIISYSNNVIKARCCVPKNLSNEHFNAEKWIEVLGGIVRSPTGPPKGQKADEVCNMREKHILSKDVLDQGLEAVKSYAYKFL